LQRQRGLTDNLFLRSRARVGFETLCSSNDVRFETSMRTQVVVLILLFVLGSALRMDAQDKRRSLPPKLLTAKSVYFDNQTGYRGVGDDTLRELDRWGRFQVVRHRDDAELILVLSSESYLDDQSKPSGGFDPDLLHLPHRPADAYLTVVDAATGQRLWADSHAWGGLLTGFNSAGRRLVNKLRKRIEH
jgi:hypothetical protein